MVQTNENLLPSSLLALFGLLHGLLLLLGLPGLVGGVVGGHGVLLLPDLFLGLVDVVPVVGDLLTTTSLVLLGLLLNKLLLLLEDLQTLFVGGSTLGVVNLELDFVE